MFYFIKRTVENVFIIKDKDRYTRVEETLRFDFSENVYKLKNLTFEELPQIEGGEKNE